MSGDVSLSDDMKEYLSFYHAHGAGVPVARIARCFGISDYDVSTWRKSSAEFATREGEIVESWPDELTNPGVPFTEKLERWLEEWERTGSRTEACANVGIKMQRVRHALEHSPPFRGQVNWLIDEGVTDAEDLVIRTARGDTKSAFTAATALLKARSPEWQNKIQVSGKIDHVHSGRVTHEAISEAKAMLANRMEQRQIEGEVIDAEIVS